MAANTREAAFTALGPEAAQLGESPVWSPVNDVVWWVDIDGRRVLCTDMDGRTECWPTPERVGFVQIDAAGHPVMGMETGIFRFDRDRKGFRRIKELDQEGVRFNDACTDSYGRLWAGTMALPGSGATGILYLVGDDLNLVPVLIGFGIINGLAWDDECERLYVSDSAPSVRTIWVFDCPGGLPDPESRRIFATQHEIDDRPDGAAIDAEGMYWIAGVDGGALHRYAPDGTRIARVPVPVSHPTKPVFGGEGMGRMFLTSKGGAGDNGRLHVWDIARDTGIRGRVETPWAAPDQDDA